MTEITNQRSYTQFIDGKRAAPGETIEVSEEVGVLALEQPDNWAGVHANDPTVCDVCGFEAKNAGGLTLHMRSHEPDNAGDGEKES